MEKLRFVPNGDFLPSSHLGDESRSGARLVLPGRRQLAFDLVVARQTMDTRLHQNQAELRVGVLAHSLQMLSDAHGLLDQMVEVLGDLGGHSLRLEDANDLVAGDATHLSHTVLVAKNHTDLRGAESFTRQLHDLLLHVAAGHLQPGGHGATIGQRRARNALSGIVHATHLRSTVALFAMY